MRSAHPDDVIAEDERAPGEEGERAKAQSLSPFVMDEYYQDAFCVLLDGGMRTCCG